MSQSLSETVKDYISNQREHHKRQTFEEEYLEILAKHGIEFDPKYVFEIEVVA